jgi:hypothetical protein
MIAIQEGHEALAQYSSILLWERESIESIAYLALACQKHFAVVLID